MPKLIIITGTPTTGKSTLAKALAKKLGYERLDLHHYYKSISSGYNIKKQAYDIDKKKFIALVKKKLSNTKTGLIVDSHISHLLPTKLVDLCIVLTCSNLKVLQQRLKQRKYSRQKISENINAEIFQICLMEAQEQGHHIKLFDTTKSSPAVILRALSKSL
ncbi:MAG TPA: adenylate kinase family protein [Candidatus Nanoarchaeia archaeon]|nr:adenylate kinase family protein [Candidatus Nanoarchaeia archaeon]